MENIVIPYSTPLQKEGFQWIKMHSKLSWNAKLSNDYFFEEDVLSQIHGDLEIWVYSVNKWGPFIICLSTNNNIIDRRATHLFI